MSTTLILEKSDPKSPNYGQHLRRRDVLDMFSPASETVEAIKKWITSSVIPEDRISRSENNQVSPYSLYPDTPGVITDPGYKQWLQFDANATEAEDLLYTTYHIYEYLSTGYKTIACDPVPRPASYPACLDPIYPNPFVNSSTPAPDKYEGPRQCGIYDPTPVISISYGGGEGETSPLPTSSANAPRS
ncbi:hypothetical protein N0V85_006617 [Neurospora sp. IMI 360204]|nr:hypothetical protein N0V85_006617 [Neurospora sp. IMI 360204]